MKLTYVDLLLITFFAACAASASYVVYQECHYDPIPEVSLASLSLTGLNVSASSRQVTGDWDARFQIQSKSLKLRYGDLESSVLYNGELLSRTVIPAFDQGLNDFTVVEAHHSAINARIGQREAFVSQATADLAHGSVGFDVRFEGKIDGRELMVFCGVVPVTVSSNGASGNFNCGPRPCTVRADLGGWLG